MEGLQSSMQAMDLFTIDDLGALITSMKIAKRETMTMTDIVSHLANMKLERSVRSTPSSQDSVPSTSFVQQSFSLNYPENISDSSRDESQNKSRSRTSPSTGNGYPHSPILESKRIRREEIGRAHV